MAEKSEENAPVSVASEGSIGTRERIDIHSQLAVHNSKIKEHDASLKLGAEHFGHIDRDVADLRRDLDKTVAAERDAWRKALDEQTSELERALDARVKDLAEGMAKLQEKIQPKRISTINVVALALTILAGPVTAVAMISWRAGTYMTREEITDDLKEIRAQKNADHDVIMKIAGKLGILP